MPAAVRTTQMRWDYRGFTACGIEREKCQKKIPKANSNQKSQAQTLPEASKLAILR